MQVLYIYIVSLSRSHTYTCEQFSILVYLEIRDTKNQFDLHSNIAAVREISQKNTPQKATDFKRQKHHGNSELLQKLSREGKI